MNNEYCYHNASLPNVLIVEDDEIDILNWSRIDDNRDDVDILCDQSPNLVLIAWMQLFAQDHVPRALICDWNLKIETIGMLRLTAADGTTHMVEGAAYVLMMAMKAVGDSGGMFVAYTNNVAAVKKDTKHWDQEHKDRLHIIDKEDMSCEELLTFVVEHCDYTSQESGLTCTDSIDEIV